MGLDYCYRSSPKSREAARGTTSARLTPEMKRVRPWYGTRTGRILLRCLKWAGAHASGTKPSRIVCCSLLGALVVVLSSARGTAQSDRSTFPHERVGCYFRFQYGVTICFLFFPTLVFPCFSFFFFSGGLCHLACFHRGTHLAVPVQGSRQKHANRTAEPKISFQHLRDFPFKLSPCDASHR